MAEGDKDSRLGLTIRRIVSAIVIVFVVPTLIRKCSHDDALQHLMADSARGLGDHDRAIAEYSRLIAADPNDASLHAGRGDSYRAQGDLDRAFADLDQAIRLDPRLWEGWLARCQAWRARNDFDRAMADCEEAARLKPDDPQPPSMAGRLLIEHGAHDAARRKFDAAVALQTQGSGLLDSRFDRGQLALFHQNRPAEAAEDLVAVLDRTFDYRQTALMLNGKDSVPMMAYRRPFVPDGVYLLMWLHIARVRAGQADAWELGDNVKRLTAALAQSPMVTYSGEPDREVLAATLRPWPGRFLALYLGRLDADAIRPAAEAATDPDTRRRRVCDVDFYLGVRAPEKGSVGEARKLLQAAADGCPAAAPEAGFARSELSRIRPEEKAGER